MRHAHEAWNEFRRVTNYESPITIMKESINITIIDRQDESHEIEVPLGVDLNLMEVAKASELPVEGTCGGMALCASCHCYVQSEHAIFDRSDDEEDMLDQAFFVEDNSRLGCQVKMVEELDGLVIKLAEVGE